MGIHRGHRARPLEWLAEKAILAISFSTIIVVFLIFVFIGRESLPVFTGHITSAALVEALPVEEMKAKPVSEVLDYLNLSRSDALERVMRNVRSAEKDFATLTANEVADTLATEPDAFSAKLERYLEPTVSNEARDLARTLPVLQGHEAEVRAWLVHRVQTILELLMEVRVEDFAEKTRTLGSDPDARVNTTAWRYLILPYQWKGYDKPEYIWQPVGNIHKYNIVPLFVGSLKTTLIGLLFAVPLALGAALYVSQLAPPKVKEWVKPAIELLAGIPSVVVGSFALLVLASVLQSVFGYPIRLNAFVAGIALGIAVIPLVFSIAEDALTSVPRSYSQAALAIGASKWRTAWDIVLPAALPGVFASVVLGFGRAIGETMIVLMVCSASVMSWSVFDSARSITTTIAAEMAEAVSGGHHYRILFMLGTLLFAVTFVTNFVGDLVINRLKGRLEGRK
jgi:phosphate transport system permease protein